MDDIVCSGSEATLANCQFRSFGYITSNCRSHLEDVSVVCSSGNVVFAGPLGNMDLSQLTLLVSLSRSHFQGFFASYILEI